MTLYHIGWFLPGRDEPEERLTRMTEEQFSQFEKTLKEAESQGRIVEYWLADAIVMTGNQAYASLLETII